MWLDDLVAPNGPQSPAVYWFRRGVLLLAVILFLWVLWPSGGGDNKTKTGSTGTGTTPSTSSSPSTIGSTGGTGTTGGTGSTPSNNAACGLADIAMSADASKGEYAAGESPVITITIKNITSGATAHTCVLQTSDRYLTISSGNDLWFSSKACVTAPSPSVTIAPNQSVTSTYTWNRKRQAKDCTVGDAATEGTYLAKAHLGTKETQGAVIRLR